METYSVTQRLHEIFELQFSFCYIALSFLSICFLFKQLQAQELRIYLKSLSADISEEKAEAGILTDLRHIIEASTICWNSKDVNENGTN